MERNEATDRDLLEAAARAAGIEVRWHEPWETHVHVGEWYEGRPLMHKAQMVWNPLTDDGDALRLAVKLRMNLDLDSDDMSNAFVPGEVQGYACDHGSDPMAATRRAIVRAAVSLACAPQPEEGP